MNSAGRCACTTRIRIPGAWCITPITSNSWSARTEWLRSLGFEQDRMAREAGIIFAVTEAELKFRRPARFNDALTVTAQVIERRRVSLRFAQAVYRDDELLCEGRVQIASLDSARFSPRPIPEALLREVPDGD